MPKNQKIEVMWSKISVLKVSEADYEMIKSMEGVSDISNVASLNLMASYKFFHFKDMDGNMLEIGQYL